MHTHLRTALSLLLAMPEGFSPSSYLAPATETGSPQARGYTGYNGSKPVDMLLGLETCLPSAVLANLVAFTLAVLLKHTAERRSTNMQFVTTPRSDEEIATPTDVFGNSSKFESLLFDDRFILGAEA